MSENSPSLSDLSSLEQDLARALQPSWAKDDGAHAERMAKLAEDSEHDRDRRGSRDERGGQRNGPRGDNRGGNRGPDRGPRRDGKSTSFNPNRGPRPDGPSGAPRQDRRPAGQGGYSGQGGQGGQDRRDNRRPREDFRPAPVPVLEGWTLQVQPELAGIEAVARQIKTQAKAYPLFDLARLVLEKGERYRIQFTRTDGAPLFVFTETGGLWFSETEAMQHALSGNLEKWYRSERITVDPPKGAYPFVAKCGLSGILIGPPNFHNYQSRLRQIHAEKYAHMAFEAYKGRITMVKDEASIQQWKDEQSTKDVYFPIEVAEGTEAPRLDSMTEVERHFREHLAPKLIQPAGDNFTTTGFAVARHSAQLVQSLARRVVEELRRFPLPLVHSLSRELEGRTLHIFKAHENITYVSVARPKYLDRTLTPVSDSVQGILEYLEGHAQTPRPEQWKALVGLRPDPAEGAEDTRENALAGDLNWLLREGHAIDFAKRSLEAARPPKPRPEAKQPKAKDKGPSQKPAKAAPSMVESIPVNEPSVAPSTPSEESASAETSPLPISEGSEVEPALIPVPPVETETITAEAPALEETPVAVLPVSNPTIEATAQPALDETPQPAEPIATASPEASPETNQPTESNL